MVFPYKIIDLTHTLSPDSPSWSGGCGFNYDIKLDYAQCIEEVKFRVQQVKMHAGIGTHIDAPSHCVPGGKTVESIALDDLSAPLIVIDVGTKARADYKISIEDIAEFEHEYEQIQSKSFVCFHTGWGQYWDNSEKYRNNHVFPSLEGAVAELLIERDVIGIGIDTLSPDLPGSGFPVHNTILGAGKYIIENVACLDKMPCVGAYVMILPLKGLGLTESPVRMIGLIHREI